MTGRFRCTVEYDGTAFFGFQRQPGRETVQGALERAIAGVIGAHTTVTGAGRTDTGVHALGQVIHFDAATGQDADSLERAINDRLPESVTIRGLHAVDGSFHARFQARSREYRYVVASGSWAPDATRGRMHHVPYALSVEAMDAAATVLCGRHDFALFGAPMVHTIAQMNAGNPLILRGGTVRTMWVARCWRQRRFVHFRFIADAYLRHMVRMIVGTLLRVGAGAIGPCIVTRLLQGDQTVFAGPAAPAQGLYLAHVSY